MKDTNTFTVADWDDFTGGTVNVQRNNGDQFNHDFTGTVKGTHGEFVIVEDQDGNCWDCDPSQLSTDP